MQAMSYFLRHSRETDSEGWLRAAELSKLTKFSVDNLEACCGVHATEKLKPRYAGGGLSYNEETRKLKLSFCDKP